MTNDTANTDKATQETVLDVRRWTDNLLSFTTTRPPGYRFIAGQFARLGLLADECMVWRAYSMTSAPKEDHLEFYSIVVPGGLFTTVLRDLQPGAKIWVEKQCFGFMTMDRFTGGEDFWMFATGTGIGPYISILRDAEAWTRFRRMIVVHGVRHASEFAYHDELRALAQRPPVDAPSPATLQVIGAVSRDKDAASAKGYLEGRITTLLEDGSLEKAAGIAMTPEASRIMMCGNPAMIEDMRRILHAREMRPVRRAIPGQFLTENYW
ncbi:ferredoxin--NADP reductase [Noviherbaspirillum massiliense]|uniref:ferredoxin--NADP reductase n=1 Tax=Noviherbaspirillum massiliense TaxID=1465823 RepID=UPI000309DF38|nr:ferredoxin--NADP reductase [Noviherbaspirillum massiliense]